MKYREATNTMKMTIVCGYNAMTILQWYSDIQCNILLMQYNANANVMCENVNV